jgi:hypothetical protein
MHPNPNRHVPSVNRRIQEYVNWYGHHLPVKSAEDGMMMDVFYERWCYAGHAFGSGHGPFGPTKGNWDFAETYCVGGNVLYLDTHVGWVECKVENRRMRGYPSNPHYAVYY